MGWKPIHEAHAIDCVRVHIQFSSPLSKKQLNKFIAPITNNFRDFGFDEIVHAEPPPAGGDEILRSAHSGWVLKRTGGERLVEEAGFRGGAFGYVSTEYGRWENLASRFWDIFKYALADAIETVDIGIIKLEYWDKFVFTGNSKDADLNVILASIDPAIPPEVLRGDSLWHSHVGWYEGHKNAMVLINRNFDVVDEHITDELRRVCKIFTLMELRQPEKVSSTKDVENLLEHLHKRSVFLFGSSISEDQRENIGLNLENYKT